MDSGNTRFRLLSGDLMPAVGLGTWQARPGDVEKAVQWALEHGYRHIDTAFAYGNEAEVGAGIRASGVPRGDIWLTTKLDNAWHTRAREALDASLASLGTDYVDLYLVHWPVALDPEHPDRVVPGWTVADTWREMQALRDAGKARNIGVSNFGIAHLEQLFAADSFRVTPAVNQIELHPLHPSRRLLAYCAAKGIHASAYSPLGSTDSPLAANPALLAIAQRHSRTPQQVLLRWGLQRGTSVLPKSVTKSRIEANLDDGSWALTDDEMDALTNLPAKARIGGDAWLPVRVFFGDDDVEPDASLAKSKV